MSELTSTLGLACTAPTLPASAPCPCPSAWAARGCEPNRDRKPLNPLLPGAAEDTTVGATAGAAAASFAVESLVHIFTPTPLGALGGGPVACSTRPISPGDRGREALFHLFTAPTVSLFFFLELRPPPPSSPRPAFSRSRRGVPSLFLLLALLDPDDMRARISFGSGNIRDVSEAPPEGILGLLPLPLPLPLPLAVLFLVVAMTAGDAAGVSDTYSVVAPGTLLTGDTNMWGARPAKC